ncbi:MAG TPA: 50S ribosomal protein L13 [Vicinamibacteria bacterium]|jgi:large subunit ribosomal protein L13|nr:50S ribosomal protein L13 [Vicinamibacteria bacterium]
MPTYIPKAGEIERKWYLIDARDKVLGKVAAKTAEILTGKRKPIYTPFLDTGDHVVVINASQVHLTGRKETGKVYRRHTGYHGGLKSATVEEVRRRQPTRVVEEAVRGMLPKTKLGRAMFTKLKVYAGDEHPHKAQKPKAIAIE